MISSSQVPLPTQHTTNIIDELPSAGIETTMPAIEGPQTHALDFTATGIGKEHNHRDETVSQYTAVTTNTGHTHVSEIGHISIYIFYVIHNNNKTHNIKYYNLMVLGYMFRLHCGHLQANFIDKVPLMCIQYGIPLGTLSVKLA